MTQSTLRRNLEGYLFLAPFLVPFCFFFVYPILEGVYVSFSNTNIATGESAFVGLHNYQALAQDLVFWHSLRNTMIFVIENVPVLILGGLLLALLLNQHFPGRGAVRSIFIAPYLITGSAIAIIWEAVLDPQAGLLNQYLAMLGLSPQAWLGAAATAMPAIVLVTLWWRVGFPLLVLLAGLQDIPQELYESAWLDGAGAFETFRFITLPRLMPVLAFVTIIRFIDSFKVFAQVYLITGGGPYGSTRVLLQYLYETGFQYYKAGYAAAIGWILFLIIMVVTVFQLRFLRSND